MTATGDPRGRGGGPRGEVAVIGLGRSGAAATRLLRAWGRAVYASDVGRTPELEQTAEALRAVGATVELGTHDPHRIAQAALVIVSPGVKFDAPPRVAARQAQVPVRAEADLGLEALAGVPYIAVTGTNGKSTTTALVAHLLGAAGFPAEAAGNIGTPLCELALRSQRPSWLAIELSSFQLHDCPRVDPAVGILTNLSPDHLDRYDTVEQYYADKRLLFRNADPDSRWVVNADDPDSLALAHAVAGRHFRFSVHREADAWYDRGRAALVVRDRVVVLRQELGLLGDHNVANALAAALAVSAIGVGTAALAEGLRSFRPLPHRLEPVREVHGVLWINDSKATNVASTRVALAAMDRPFVLLMGGQPKGESYAGVAPLLGERCRAVLAYGQAAPLIARDLRDAIPVEEVERFGDALERAARLAQPGEAVLLSPACASFDQFRDYQHRGAAFRSWVEEQ